ncbi:hypothetical protein Goari_006323 [Gossypium aridum]|uniref:Endonuclease/exonuclease/phosphatase domain-containing protein n=1 Tax=Gossypium aridum TaxID=34290 RepID=A0A7J8XMM2_GOSAI|nr:hypothetical protein [Gossypium aridum]
MSPGSVPGSSSSSEQFSPRFGCLLVVRGDWTDVIDSDVVPIKVVDILTRINPLVLETISFSFSAAPMEEKPESDMPPSTDKLNELLERLKFLEEEEAMYRVFKLLWYTKEEVDFVALKEGVSSWHVKTAMDVGNALGELIAIDWKDRFGGWTEFMRLKVKIDVSKPLRRPEYKGKERSWEEESLSISPMDRRNQKTIRDGMGRFKSDGWRSALPRAMKKFSWNCREVGNPAAVRELKQLLIANGPDVIFLCETKIHSNSFSRIRSIYRMEGCLAVSSGGKSSGLALLWREGVKVVVQNYSNYHIDSLITLDESVVVTPLT